MLLKRVLSPSARARLLARRPVLVVVALLIKLLVLVWLGTFSGCSLRASEVVTRRRKDTQKDRLGGVAVVGGGGGEREGLVSEGMQGALARSLAR